MTGQSGADAILRRVDRASSWELGLFVLLVPVVAGLVMAALLWAWQVLQVRMVPGPAVFLQARAAAAAGMAPDCCGCGTVMAGSMD